MKTRLKLFIHVVLLTAMLTPNIVLSQHYLLSGQEIIIRQLNGTGTDWRISPDLNPDRLEIYFNNNQETQDQFAKNLANPQAQVKLFKTARKP